MPSGDRLWEHYKVEYSELSGYLLVRWLNRLHAEGWHLITVSGKDYYFAREGK